MRTFIRIAAVVLVFAVASPPLGMALLMAADIGLGYPLTGDTALFDLLESILEFGHFGAIAGLAFATVAYCLAGNGGFLSRSVGRALVGATSMWLVFGSLVAHKFVVYGHFSTALTIVGAVAALVGAGIGGMYPMRFLALRSQNAD